MPSHTFRFAHHGRTLISSFIYRTPPRYPWWEAGFAALGRNQPLHRYADQKCPAFFLEIASSCALHVCSSPPTSVLALMGHTKRSSSESRQTLLRSVPLCSDALLPQHRGAASPCDNQHTCGLLLPSSVNLQRNLEYTATTRCVWIREIPHPLDRFSKLDCPRGRGPTLQDAYVDGSKA